MMLNLELKHSFDSFAFSDHVRRMHALLASLDVKGVYSTSPDYQETVEALIDALQTQGIDNAYHQACMLFSVLQGGVKLEQMPENLPLPQRVVYTIQMAIHEGVQRGAYDHIYSVLAGVGSSRQAWLNSEPEANCLELLSQGGLEEPCLELMCFHHGLSDPLVAQQFHHGAHCFRAQSGFQHKVFGVYSPDNLLAQVCRATLNEDPFVVSPTALVERCELGMLTPSGFVPTQQLHVYDARQIKLNFTQREFALDSLSKATLLKNSEGTVHITNPCLNADLQFLAGWQKGAAGFEFRLEGDMQLRMPANVLVWEANLQQHGVLVNLGIQLQQDLAIDWAINDAIQVGQLPFGVPLFERQADAPLRVQVNSVVCVGKPVVNAVQAIAGRLKLKLHAQIDPETRQFGVFLALSHSDLLANWQAIDPLLGWCRGGWQLGSELTVAQWDLSHG